MPHRAQYRPVLRGTQFAEREGIEAADAVVLVATQAAAHTQPVVDEVLVAAALFVQPTGFHAERDRAAFQAPPVPCVDAGRAPAQVDHAAGAARRALCRDRDREELHHVAHHAVAADPVLATGRVRVFPTRADLRVVDLLARVEGFRGRVGAVRIALPLRARQAQRVVGPRLAEPARDHAQARMIGIGASTARWRPSCARSRRTVRPFAVGGEPAAERAPAPRIVRTGAFHARGDARAGVGADPAVPPRRRVRRPARSRRRSRRRRRCRTAAPAGRAAPGCGRAR